MAGESDTQAAAARRGDEGDRRRSRPASGGGDAQVAAAYQGGGRGATGGDRGPRAAGDGATRRRLQPAKVAEGTSRRGPHGSGRKQHTGDRRRGAPQCLSDTTCAGADRRGPYRRKERATADAGGGHPLAGRRSTPPPGAPPRPGKGAPPTPALAGWHGVHPPPGAAPRPGNGAAPAARLGRVRPLYYGPQQGGGRPGVRRGRGDRLRGRDDEPLRCRRRASSAPPDDGG